MSNVKVEGQHTAEFIVSEANGYRSREDITVVKGQNLEAGHVLGKITSSGKYKEYNPSNGDGSGTAVAVLYDNVDATDEDKQATAVVRDAEVNAGEIVWFNGATTAQKTTGQDELANVGIVTR